MLRYYFGLAFESLRRTPWLTLLMILSMAVGIAASMTTITLRHVLALDPVPGKSERLFSLQDPSGASPTQSLFSYADANALRRLASHRADSVIFGAGITNALSAVGHREVIRQGVGIQYATRDFFRVFNVPLKRGRIWTRQEEDNASPVVVLEESTARELFRGEDAIGQSLRVGTTQYTVIGITGHWNPRPRYYDLNGVAGAFGGGGDAIFLPVTVMQYAPDDLMVTRACPGVLAALPSPPELLSSQCQWLSVWYLARTRRDGRMLAHSLGRGLASVLPPDRAHLMHLMDVRQMLLHADVVPAPVRMYALLGVAFLILCTINASGMQLSRVLRTSQQIGIRRALGARRSEIVVQYVCDALLVSCIGGVLGTGLTFVGLYTVRQLPDVYYADLAHMDGVMFILMAALVVACGTLVGLIPAWLASRIDPVRLIKVPQ